MQETLVRLESERSLAERELAVGEWGRARRRTAAAVQALDGHLRRGEPELWHWLRILATLAGAERSNGSSAQLPLWPEREIPGGSAGAREQDPTGRTGAALHGCGVITRDERMRAALSFLGALAPTRLPVLLEGETGSGKEIVARAVHALSGRSPAEFVAVNCGAIPGELQESELFGHARGAYTGALVDKPGLFEAAHAGTLFLDEIGEMDARAQVKLLRVLETGEIRRVGELRTRTVDVRIVAATNADVDRAVAGGGFRRDLLFRLGAVRVRLPPLRERAGDILPLALHFLRRAVVRAPLLTPAAQRALLRHDWPGNVRELKFVIERAAALWQQSGQAELPEELLLLDSEGWLGWNGGRGARGSGRARAGGRVAAGAGGSGAGDADGAGEEGLPEEVPAGHTLESFLERIERNLIFQAVAHSGGNRSAAARLLGGLSRTTLIGKMRRLGVEMPSTE